VAPGAGDGGALARGADAGAGRGLVDGGAPAGDAGVDPRREAATLFEQARAALDDNDVPLALSLAEDSLRLRKTARSYLVLADALRRLGKTDEAMRAIDGARGLAPTYAPAWALQIRVLLGAGRRDEATAAYQRYLELAPTGREASELRSLMGAP
jgi:tetratricopeptide (TPR) repeat protein